MRIWKVEGQRSRVLANRPPVFDLASVLEVLRTVSEPVEPKRTHAVAIAVDVIRYIYSGGSIETLPEGHSRWSINGSRRLPKPPLVEDVVVRSLLPRLRCASIAAHVAITPRLRNRILNLPASLTMENLRCFLFWEQTDNLLARAIRKQHVPIAIEAYRAFVDSIAVWSVQRRPEKPHTPWLVPNQYLRAVVEGQLEDLPMVAQEVLYTSSTVPCNPDPVWRTGLLHLTLGAATALGNMHSTVLRALNQSLSALVKYMNPNAKSTSPWDAKFPKDLRPVPTAAMFPFRPEATVRKAIMSLATQDVQTLGDLRCLHPRVICLAKEPTKPLVRLHVALDEAARSSASGLSVF